MPDATVIDAGQREGLYELVRNHLGGIEDFWVALERTRDFATAERLGRELAEDFRLLEDIGWAPGEAGKSFTLTMPPGELAALAGRLREEAGQVLAGASGRPASREDEATDDRFAAGLDACEAILAGIRSSALPPQAAQHLAPLPISGEQREALRDLMTHRLFAAGGGPPPGRRAPEQLICDALLTYQLAEPDGAGSIAYRFVEVDRANRSAVDLARQIGRYGRLYRRRVPAERGHGSVVLWERLYGAFPVVLLVLAGRPRERLEERRRTVLALCSQEPDLLDSPEVGLSACLLEDLVERGPFAPICRTLDDPDRDVDWLGEEDG